MSKQDAEKRAPVPNAAAGAEGANALWERARTAAAAGNLAAAEQLTQQLLVIEPRHADGQCLLAELYRVSGRTDAALHQLQRATTLMPGVARLHYSLGALHLAQGESESALVCFERAIALEPGFAQAHASAGIALRRTNRTAEAVDAYRKAIALKPDLAEAYTNLGVALTDLGQYREAVDAYQRLLALRPDAADAYHGLGLCMDWLGDLDQARAYYEQGLRVNRSHVGIWNNLGSVYLAQNRLQKSLQAFRRSAELKFDHGRPLKGPLNMILHRIRHDAEQLRYIDAKVGVPPQHRDYFAALCELEAKYADRPGTDKVPVDARTAQRVAPSFNRIVHRAECPEIPGGALNPDVDWAACEAAYLNATPEVAAIDGFLRPEAVAALRNYCLESTVWKTVRPYGYMGTLIADGFATPLLLQIAAELRARLPKILSAHALGQAWAYKYDNSLSAINIHADCAAVNINFWITPDSANLDPESGGLVLWDKAPPADWGLMRTQNPDKTEIKDYLRSSGAQTIRVPHRQNRVVLFNSALFHKSDHMKFKDGYENRRINVTLLYGNGLR